MNKNSTGRVELKSMLKISLSCLSGNIKEKWPNVQKENWHGRLHCDLAERWRSYNYFNLFIVFVSNKFYGWPWDEKYLLRQQLNARPCMNLFSEDSKKKSVRVTTVPFCGCRRDLGSVVLRAQPKSSLRQARSAARVFPSSGPVILVLALIGYERRGSLGKETNWTRHSVVVSNFQA